MNLGLYLAIYSNYSLREVLEKIDELELNTVEISAGGYPSNNHCNPEILLNNSEEFKIFDNLFKKRSINISALSVHGNVLNPNKDLAKKHHSELKNAIKLASKLGVDTIVTFSGCPGESYNSLYPVWVTCPWPDEQTDILNWQWEEVTIPYWKEMNKFAQEYNVRIAIEPHPGFVVYNNETALRLREECGKNIGVNYDPSHLFWQGINPISSLKQLLDHECVYHIHAKDTKLIKSNIELNGVLDTKSYKDIKNRSWVFRTVGYGHDKLFWSDLINTLKIYGYQGTVSIEHEDDLMTIDQGVTKAVDLLKDIIN